MTTRIETDLTKIDKHLADVISRGKVPLISTRAIMFKDETFWIRETDDDSAYAFSDRGDYWGWSWGASPAVTTVIIFEDYLTKAFAEAASRWPGKPFSFIYHDECPSALEREGGLIADHMVEAINNIRPGSAIRVDPGVKMAFKIGVGSSQPNGNVLAHGKIVRIKESVFDFSSGTPDGVTIT